MTKQNVFIASLLLAGLTSASYVSAACWVNEGSAATNTVATVPSFSLLNNGLQGLSFAAGLGCRGILVVGSSNWLRYHVIDVPNFLTNAQGDRLLVTVTDPNSNNVQIKNGDDKDLSAFAFLTFFTGPNGNFQFRINVPAGQNLPAGQYTGKLRTRWFYSQGELGVWPLVIYSNSPGLDRGGPWWGFSWGTGLVSDTTVVVTIEPDCVIQANNIDFGVASFTSQFNPVNRKINVRCTAKSAYTVGISDGGSAKAPRELKRDGGSDTIKYDLYKGTTSERWGSVGDQRWRSENASSNPNVHDAVTIQGYDFTAKIIDENKDVPVGTYRDSLVVEVKF